MKRTDLPNNLQLLLSKVDYIAISTVTPDCMPWISPVYAKFDDSLNFYWASWSDNQHSINIANNSNIFAVIYDTSSKEDDAIGLYLKANAVEIENEQEISAALKLLDSNYHGYEPLRFLGDKPRRVYKATPYEISINGGSEFAGDYIDVREIIGDRA